jgi:hypothetical protein
MSFLINRMALVMIAALPLNMAMACDTDCQTNPSSDFALGLSLGTMGIGATAVYAVAPQVNLRAQVNMLSINHDFSESGVDYQADAKARGLSVLADFMPIEKSSFRLTIGTMRSDNALDVEGQSSLAGKQSIQKTVGNTTTLSDGTTTVTLTASANGSSTIKYAGQTYNIKSGQTYTHNGNTYVFGVEQTNGNYQTVVTNTKTNTTTSLVTELKDVVAQTQFNANVKWDDFNPYVGMGWGQPFDRDSAWSWSLDLGAYYMGKPKVTGSSQCLGTSDACAALVSVLNDDREKQIKKLQDKLDKFIFAPVVMAGLSYRF